MRFRLLPLFAIVMFPWSCPAAGYHYEIRDGGFWIHNGPAYFNRPLFGTHEPSMLLSGERPAFAYWEPTNAGKIGTLYLGLVTPAGSKWLHEATDIGFQYRPGLTRHIIQDSIIPGGSLEITTVPLSMGEGFAVRMRWISRPSVPVKLVWALGGASGAGNGYRSPPVAELHLNESDTVNNVLQVWGNRFSLTSPTMKGKEILGTCDLEGRLGIKNVRDVLQGPAAAERAFPSQTAVVTFSGEWPQAQPSVHLLFTLDGVQKLEQMAAHPARTFDESIEFYRNLARRVTVKTPDPYFDLAVEAMVIATDGTWKPPTFVHGAVSWMLPYLGWRIWYGPEAFGWHDRVLSSILAFTSRQIQQGDARGALPDMPDSNAVGYNMNEVFLDHLYYHYLWTGDRGLLASLFPVIQGILSWEKRRLDTDDNALYESCLNTWISDSHWYSGGDTTQASAYMFRGHQLAAEAAEAAGADPLPFRREAERIRAALNSKLWLASEGHYAEFIDRLGLKRIHPEPELPTIYHPIDFGVTDQFQAYQMLRFTETRLRNETGIPNGGRLAWSSNWAPNYDRHYTHSTYDLVFAESLNLAIAYYRAGQFDKAYELVKGVYASLYQGGIPGGLSCHAYANGQQRANEEFADSISMFGRTAVEGVFGILPEMQHGLIHISPGFPQGWKDASIATPDLSYRFHKTDAEISLEVDTVKPLRIHYRLPLFGARAVEASINGAPVEVHVDPGIGGAFVDLTGPSGTRSSLRVKFKPEETALRFKPVVATGERLTIGNGRDSLREFKDPQGLLEKATLEKFSLAGNVKGTLGPHTLFVLTGDAKNSRWEAVNMEVRAPVEILNPQVDSNSGQCRFTLRNNTGTALKLKATAHWAGKTTGLDGNLSSEAEEKFTAEGDATALLLGKNPLEIEGLPGNTLTAEVPYWPPALPARAGVAKWQPVVLEPFYNDRLSTVLSHSFWTSGTDYPYAVCRDYMLEHLIGARTGRPNDQLLRSRINSQGVFVTAAGIPFAQRAEGNNIVALSRWKEFPNHAAVPVGDTARKIYLLISGVTFPMQSQIANVRVTIKYADGGKTDLDLVNPENFDTGWAGFFGGNYHYAANGMEVIGSGPPEEKDVMSWHMPSGKTGSIITQQGVPEPLDYSQWATATHADIVDVDCDPVRKIHDVEISVLSNEIIVALHGVTLLK